MGRVIRKCRKVQAVYQFDILEKKGGKVVKTWTIDVKNGKGHCKEGKPRFPPPRPGSIALLPGSCRSPAPPGGSNRRRRGHRAMRS